MYSSKHGDADVELHIQTQESAFGAQIENPVTPGPAPEASEPATIPRQTWKLFSAGFSFFVAGVNDGSMGALLPYILQEYHVGTSFIAVL
jgi:hypothetical protein